MTSLSMNRQDRVMPYVLEPLSAMTINKGSKNLFDKYDKNSKNRKNCTSIDKENTSPD